MESKGNHVVPNNLEAVFDSVPNIFYRHLLHMYHETADLGSETDRRCGG